MNKADPFGDMETASDLTTDGEVSNSQSSALPQEPIQADNVGALLCATRMRMSGDLQAIAKILRIRYGYLVAIEDGRYEDLPGSAYSVGFVRAYADYLGLDGNEVVRRLREETDGTVTTARFEFPAPSGDNGLPNGGLLAIAIGMGVLVYGAWYATTNSDRDAVDLVQEMPSRIAVLIDEDSTSLETAEPNVAEVIVPPAEQTEVSADDGVIVDAPDEPDVLPRTAELFENSDASQLNSTPSAEPEVDAAMLEDSGFDLPSQNEAEVVVTVPPTDLPQTNQLAMVDDGGSVAELEPDARGEVSSSDLSVDPEVQPVVAVNVVEPTDVQSGSDVGESNGIFEASDEDDAPLAEVVQDEDGISEDSEMNVVDAQIGAPESGISDSAEMSVDELTALETAGGSSVEEADPDETVSVPPDEADMKEETEVAEAESGQVIELRAKSDSWIQVRDGDELLLTRLLREGEVYQVPERSGLTLMTGNAGGLEVFVGGEQMPPLGDEGVVRRGVPLNPERLRSGTTPG